MANKPGRVHDISNQKFGKWVVIDFDCVKYTNAYWNVECECGFKKSVTGNSLKRGDSKGCRRCNSTERMGENTTSYGTDKFANKK